MGGCMASYSTKNPPYDEPRRNGKVPKILTHRLFPQAQYSIWIDGKMELIVDPLLLLERHGLVEIFVNHKNKIYSPSPYSSKWSIRLKMSSDEMKVTPADILAEQFFFLNLLMSHGLEMNKNTFAIAQHKHHRSIYEEADANKRRKRYARPLIDLHMKIYRYEGMEPWSIKKNTVSGKKNLTLLAQSYLLPPWLGSSFKFYMFPNCEYNSLFVLHPHTREHSSKIEWVKNTAELMGKGSSMKESRGGLGLWTPYPGDLNLVVMPPIARTSKAG
ncbi:hypothetical protein Pint_33544 [Pistacia integerrima]|uniref:Uncharacterized protein n=1 Tax=Pistacia integerrima TaxID=434235 RepID=A0ACC0X4K5_9ROSI|nr:hypothetical protein Pint_33544 [Pistacia integerrima]